MSTLTKLKEQMRQDFEQTSTTKLRPLIFESDLKRSGIWMIKRSPSFQLVSKRVGYRVWALV